MECIICNVIFVKYDLSTKYKHFLHVPACSPVFMHILALLRLKSKSQGCPKKAGL